MPAILTIQNQIQCPHGGQAILTTTNSVLTVDGIPALLETDMPVIVGCPFTVGVVYSPCAVIQWSGAAEYLTVNDVGVVLATSQGLCSNAAGAPQGPAMINDATPEVGAL
jgi:hypothetical protein